jgi:outer membrane lipoprotein-sorting protein
MKFAWCLLAMLYFSCAAVAAVPTTLPTTAPAGIDESLWDRMKAIDHAAAQITDLTADFEQTKITALLKNPMKSTGQLWARGSEMLWKTVTPEPMTMRVDSTGITLYYPKQKTAEVYPSTGELAGLTTSPVPRLTDLLQHFNFASASSRDFDMAPSPDTQAFLLTPTDPKIREHVDHVNVLIDAKLGVLLVMKLTDADDETTTLRFSNIKMNTSFDAKLLQLNLPGDVKTVHPLENIGPRP